MIPVSDVPGTVADALDARVIDSTELDGGEVGHVVRVSLADGRTVAAKTGDAPLSVEADMLAFLADRGPPVPEIHHESDELLVMEYVAGDGELTPAAERDVARHLAALHEESPERSEGANAEEPWNGVDRSFGFPYDTLSGPYRQPNPWTGSWVAFYRDQRLRHVAERAREAELLAAPLWERLDELAADLGSWLPESPPSSLLHGDAWAGNLVVADGRVRAFLDPACYFGHAEVELAYAAFAGFGDPFFETYERERAIDPGFFEGRREIYQLYPLLEHLLYFEDGRYADRIEGVLGDVGY